MTKLSHSAASRFQTCPKSYEFHYIQKLRPKLQHAALMFGTAVDRGITALLKRHAGEEEKQSPQDVFAYTWRFQEVNGKDTYLPTCTEIVYSNTDYDEDLVLPEDWEKMKEKHNVEDPLIEVRSIIARKDIVGYNGLPDESKKLFNNANWCALYRKGLLMLKAVETQILPNVLEVLDTQGYVSLENDEGDKVIGYADLICRYKGYDTPIVFDFKTSSRAYAADAVTMSPQLTLYVHSFAEKYNTRLAGFIVLNKHIQKNKTKICSACKHDGTGGRHKTCNAEINGKRCGAEWIETFDPEALVTVLIDTISPQVEDIVLENFDQINIMIKKGIFTRNFQSCDMGWGPCPYKALCFQGDSSGLCQSGSKKE